MITIIINMITSSIIINFNNYISAGPAAPPETGERLGAPGVGRRP